MEMCSFTPSSKVLLFIILYIQCLASQAKQVGYQFLPVYGPVIKRDIDVALCYPTEAEPRPESIGPLSLNVAVNAPASDQKTQLLILSHGFSASHSGHHDIAQYFVRLGYLVVTPSHPDRAGLNSKSANLDPLVYFARGT